MSDHQSDMALQEVDEEVRRERMRSLWSRYGKLIIGGAVGIVLVVAGREFWTDYTIKQELANAAAFDEAFEAAVADSATAAAAWDAAVPKMDGGYKALARFQLAASYLRARNFDLAIETYDAIAADGSISDSYQDLARLLAAMTVVDSLEDLDAARSRLSVVAVEGRTWYHSATEQLALIDLLEGETVAAREKFARLAFDASTPSSLSARASRYEAMLREPITGQTTEAATLDAPIPAQDEVAPEAENENAPDAEENPEDPEVVEGPDGSEDSRIDPAPSDDGVGL